MPRSASMSKMEKFQHVIANLSREEVKQVISTVIHHNAVSVDDLKQTLKEVNQRIMKETTIDLSDGEETPEVTPKRKEKADKVLLFPAGVDQILLDYCGDDECRYFNLRIMDYGEKNLPDDIQAVKLSDYEAFRKFPRGTYSMLNKLLPKGSMNRVMKGIDHFPGKLFKECKKYIEMNSMTFSEFREIVSSKKNQSSKKKRKHEEEDTGSPKKKTKCDSKTFVNLFDAVVNADTWRFKNRGSVFEDRTEAYKTAMEECKDFCKETDGNKLACLKYMLNRHTGEDLVPVYTELVLALGFRFKALESTYTNMPHYLFSGQDVGPKRKKPAVNTASFNIEKVLKTNFKTRLIGTRGVKYNPQFGKNYINHWKKNTEVKINMRSTIYGIEKDGVFVKKN